MTCHGILSANRNLKAVLLSLLLLCSQAAVLVHSIEHPYFGHKATCVLCQFGHQDKSAVHVPTFFLPPCKQHFVEAAYIPQAIETVAVRRYQSRAPPVFS